jgi:hypothetical protein
MSENRPRGLPYRRPTQCSRPGKPRQ